MEAALWQEREKQAGRKVAVILTGGNIDRTLYTRILNEVDADDRI